jgi:hypothetical protein
MVSAIFRADHTEEEFLGDSMTNTMFMAGLGFQVESGVEFIPNVIVDKDSEFDDPMITGRVTLFVTIK